MFSKTVTEKIVRYWGLGFTAEETQDALKQRDSITISLHTIYNKRRSLTAQDLIDELVRTQEREIFKTATGQTGDDGHMAVAPNPIAAMKYRNELLKILVPQRIEAYGMSKHEEKLIVELWNPRDTESKDTVQPARRPETIPPSTLQKTV